jgi:2-hydroxycyclohexanecarboxyl-CoA dehydrogenase
MDLKLKGKSVLVTGAGSQIGYGKAIALNFAQEGCDVAIADINLGGAERTAAEIEKSGAKAIAVKADIANRKEVDSLAKEVIDRFGKIDVLVNNAGTSSKLKPFMEMTRPEWDLDIGVNLIGQMNMCQAVIPYMAARKYGRIVNFSGGQGVPAISIYGAAKAGVEMFTHALALEVSTFGIIVNAVDPGLGQTGLVVDATREMLEGYAHRSALKRLCTPQDVAPVVAFLASDICSYMAGQTIRLWTH